MELNLNEEITCKRQNTASCPTNVSQALYQALQPTKMNFEKLLLGKFLLLMFCVIILFWWQLQRSEF